MTDALTDLRAAWFEGVEPGPWHPAHRGPIVLDNANGDSLFVDATDAATLINALESYSLIPTEELAGLRAAAQAFIKAADRSPNWKGNPAMVAAIAALRAALEAKGPRP